MENNNMFESTLDKASNSLEKIAKIASIIGSLFAIITTIVTSVLLVLGKIEECMKSPWFQAVFFIFCIFMAISLVILIVNKRQIETKARESEQQNKQLRSDVQLLRENICSGLEFLTNEVNIKFIKGKTSSDHKYMLTFHKRCRIIGESKWYSGQVYFNNRLQDEAASEKFYFNNQITWESLNATAHIRTYTQDGASNDHDADIYAVAKSPRYFQFHIRYGTSGARISPAEYDSFEIIYSYEVPITHWGSYINRTISYFGEPTKVVIQLDLRNLRTVKQQTNMINRFIDEITVYEKKLDQDPTILTKDSFNCSGEPRDTTGYITIELPKARAKKYIVQWDPTIYFGPDCLKTEIKKDSAELTAQ